MRVGLTAVGILGLLVGCGSPTGNTALTRDSASTTTTAGPTSAPPTTTPDAGDAGDTTTTRPTTTTVAARGSWRTVAAAPANASQTGAPVWTGAELIMWSGQDDGARATGAAYRPDTNQWAEVPAAPISPRTGHSSVWTGTEVIYWGGVAGMYGPKMFADGAAYNPATGRWRELPPSPLEPRAGHEAVWIGTEMIVWGGYTECCPIDSVIHDAGAAAYDPARGSWRTLPAVPPPWSGDDGGAATFAHDDTMLVWRNEHLGAMALATGQWTDLGAPQVPESSCSTTAGPVSAAELVGDTVVAWVGGCATEHGVAYDMSTREWRRVADTGTGIGPLTATDAAIYAVSGYSSAGEPVTLRAYSVRDDAWRSLAAPPIALGNYPVVEWTGREVLVWGGYSNDGEVRTGAAYRP